MLNVESWAVMAYVVHDHSSCEPGSEAIVAAELVYGTELSLS